MDELCELGEGDSREVVFADGSSMKPRATGGMGSRRTGTTDPGSRWEVDGGEPENNMNDYEPPSTEKRYDYLILML